MSITYVSGDPLLTQAQVLAFGHNRRGQIESGELESRLMYLYPAAFSSYARQCRRGRIASGEHWVWRESQPYLMFLTIRESSVGATRLRYVQSIAIEIARRHLLEGYNSLAVAPLGEPAEWPEIKLILESWLQQAKLRVIVYDEYQPDVQVNEG